jgi:hypothetical protein
MNKYLRIPFEYTDKEGNKSLVSFFLPISFIESGDLKDWKLEPDNFLGVNLKGLLASIDKAELI